MMALSRIETLIRQLQGASKIAFPFGAGWGDYGGGTWEPVTYSRHGRVVRLQGLASKTGGAPAAGNVIGTLPAGFRPAMQLMFGVATGATYAFGRVDVAANGDVVWQAGNAVEQDFTSLSGISFVVEP